MLELQTFDQIGEKTWDDFVLHASNGSIHHLSLWKRLQEKVPTRGKVLGWAAVSNGTIKAASLLVRMKTGFGEAEWFYAARGPVFTDRRAAEFLVQKISTKLANTTKALFWRFDPYITSDQPQLVVDGFVTKPAIQNYHPPDTSIIDLTKDTEAVLAGMKKKRRYDIRSALKTFQIDVIAAKNVKPQDIDDFYGLLTETSEANKFSPHPKNYYAHFLRELSPYATLWFATKDTKRVAASILTVCGDKALYYFAALTRDPLVRKENPSHAIVWKQIEYATSKQATTFDLLGIAPEGAKSTHPYAGITTFKEGFGGMRVSYHSGVEVSLRPSGHALYRIAKRIKR